MKAPFSSWHGFLAWLDQLGMFRMELDLSRMDAALRLCGLCRPPYPVIQVVGTNGKGSTCAFLAELARSHGLKAGLYTSPHFLSPSERIQVDGRELSREQWLEEGRIIEEATAALRPSYFEFLTLLAMRLFERSGVDLAILEAGLGGRHDATSAIHSDICCFSPIAMDHEAILGPGILNIAKDKADALKAQKLAFSAPQFPLVAKALADAAKERGIPLEFVAPLPEDQPLRPGMGGRHQLVNAALALAAWRGLAKTLRIEPQADAENGALSRAFIPGRMQSISATEAHPALLLDGAHNPHAIAALAKQDIKPGCVIFSALADKNWKSGVAALCGRFPEAPVLVPQLANARAAKAPEIAHFCKSLHVQAQAAQEPYAMLKSLGLAASLAQRGQPVLVCGSLYLLAAFYGLFPQYLKKYGDCNDNALCP